RYQERLRITGRVPALKVQKKTYRVIDGVHRREAALREGAAKLGCEVYDVPDSELRAIAYFSNREHGVPISTSDRNKAILDFYTKDGKTEEQISQLTGLTKQRVAQILSASKAALLSDSDKRRKLSSAEETSIIRLLLKKESQRDIANRFGIAQNTVSNIKTKTYD